jgi:hypothetical protein
VRDAAATGGSAISARAFVPTTVEHDAFPSATAATAATSVAHPRPCHSTTSLYTPGPSVSLSICLSLRKNPGLDHNLRKRSKLRICWSGLSLSTLIFTHNWVAEYSLIKKVFSVIFLKKEGKAKLLSTFRWIPREGCSDVNVSYL